MCIFLFYFVYYRKWKGTLVLNEECYFLTPFSWKTFFTDHVTVELIRILQLNDCYWLPGDLLCATLQTMTNLHELGLKNTQLSSVPLLAKVLKTCDKIRKLDFGCTEATLRDVKAGLEREKLSLEAFVASFRKLTHLKLSVTVRGTNFSLLATDPWVLIIQLLRLELILNLFLTMIKIIKLSMKFW